MLPMPVTSGPTPVSHLEVVTVVTPPGPSELEQNEPAPGQLVPV